MSMKMKKGIVITAMILLLASCSMNTIVYAGEICTKEAEERIADKIVVKYREYKGRLQYRRWNETKGYWVDSHWIDV